MNRLDDPRIRHDPNNHTLTTVMSLVFIHNAPAIKPIGIRNTPLLKRSVNVFSIVVIGSLINSLPFSPANFYPLPPIYPIIPPINTKTAPIVIIVNNSFGIYPPIAKDDVI